MADFSFFPHISLDISWVNLHRWTPGSVDERRHLHTDASALTHCAVWLVRSPGIEVSEMSPQGTPQRTWQLQPDEIFLWPMDRPRRICTPQGGEWISVGMMAHLFRRIDLFPLLKAPRRIALKNGQLDLVKSSFDQLLLLMHGLKPPAIDLQQARHPSERPAPVFSARAFSRWTAQALAESIFGICWMACADSHETQLMEQEIPSWLMQVLTEVNRRPALKVTEMSGIAGFSHAQFRRLFIKWMGQPPQQYLHSNRLERARQLLESTDWAIADISHQVGFASSSHFARTFRQTFGNTPEQYRRSAQDG